MIYSVWLHERAAAGSLEYEEACKRVCLYAVFLFVCLFMWKQLILSKRLQE